MKINVIASGSDGNCSIVNSSVMLDAGISLKAIQKALNYDLPSYALVTHEHSDHANFNTIKELLLRGVDVFMTAGTADALGLNHCYNLHFMDWLPVNVGEYTFTAIPIQHDAAQPAAFSINYGDERLLYLTDAKDVPIYGDFTHMIIESNFFESSLKSSTIDDKQRQRIFNNHLSFERLARYLKDNPYTTLSEVHLIHVSKRHGDPDAFKSALGKIIDIPVFVH